MSGGSGSGKPHSVDTPAGVVVRAARPQSVLLIHNGRRVVLTARQAECLRLVGRSLQVNEIASELNVSISAIDKQLTGARRALETTSSMEAALILAEHDLQKGSRLAPDHEIGLFEGPGDGSAISSDANQPVADRTMLNDSIKRSAMPPAPAIRPWRSYLWRPSGASINDLTIYERLAVSAFGSLCIGIAATMPFIGLALLRNFLIAASQHSL